MTDDELTDEEKAALVWMVADDDDVFAAFDAHEPRNAQERKVHARFRALRLAALDRREDGA